MTDLPLVSIVTPCYNAAAYLERTIRSVLEQDYPQLEYIVMDGGSTDGTLEILSRYGDRLQFFSSPDNGTSDAINKGFRRSSGAIFAWLNADDLYLPGAVRKAVESLRLCPSASVVYGDAFWVDSADRVVGQYPTVPFDAEHLRRECFICQPASFLRSEAFRSIGMLDAADQFTFDYDLWIRLEQQCARFEYLRQPLAHSRMHSDTKTLGARKQILKAGMDLLGRHYGYIPVQWVYHYCYYLLHPGDQFFTPVKKAIDAYALSLVMGAWLNRRQISPYLEEWWEIAWRQVARTGSQAR
jgi:glycosyltransferase involved in cell wall biosynthesis